jgi:predicted aconitase with swiveling domain
VTRDRISGWGGIDPRSGTVIETRHELRGISFAGKGPRLPGGERLVGLVEPVPRRAAGRQGAHRMVFNEMTTKIALGAVVAHAPSVTDFDQDPLQVIETGDWVKVDGDNGVVEVTKKG